MAYLNKETPAEYTARKQKQAERTNKKETPEEYASRKAYMQEKTHNKETSAEYAARKLLQVKKNNSKNKQTISGINGGPGSSCFNPAFTYNSKVGYYVNEQPDATRYYIENEPDHAKYSGDLYKNNTHYYEKNINPDKYHPVGKGRWWNKDRLCWE
jgi:hypothetical protein